MACIKLQKTWQLQYQAYQTDYLQNQHIVHHLLIPCKEDQHQNNPDLGGQ